METGAKGETSDTTVSQMKLSAEKLYTRPESPNHEVGSFTDGLLSEQVEIDYHKEANRDPTSQSMMENQRYSRSSLRSLPRQSNSNEHVITRFDDTNMVELDLQEHLGKPSTSSERNVNVDMKSCTLPASLDRRNNEQLPECSIFDPSTIGKLSKWGTFKRRLYLGAAHNMHVKKVVDGPIGADGGPPGNDETYEKVTDFEGLDLDGVPTLTQKSRKLFSWSRLKLGFGIKKRHPHDTAEIDNEQQESTEASEKISRNKWLNTLSQRLNPLRLYEQRDVSASQRENKEEVASGSND